MEVIRLAHMSYCMWVLWLLHHSADAADISHECFRDADCSAASYCDQSTMVCEICVPCKSLFNRAAADDARNCAKTEEECGQCLYGYQSEDLTGQRHSYKCYPITDQQLEVPFTSTHVISWKEFTTLSSTIVVLAAILVAFATYYVKSRNGVPMESLSEENVERVSIKDDSLPPPYNQVVSSVQTFTFATREPEYLNEATPIGRYHMSIEENSLDPDDLDFDRGLRSEEESTAGSTETIPSMWEHGQLPISDLASAPIQLDPVQLVRSQSLTMLNLLSDSPSRSCPNLPSSSRGIHRHRHVLLSNYRRPTASDSSVKMEEGRCVEFSEPLPPHSFPYEESEQAIIQGVNQRGRLFLRSLSAPEDNTGSQDAVFIDPSNFLSLSRRRPAANDELPFTMAIANKRRRKE